MKIPDEMREVAKLLQRFLEQQGYMVPTSVCLNCVGVINGLQYFKNMNIGALTKEEKTSLVKDSEKMHEIMTNPMFKEYSEEERSELLAQLYIELIRAGIPEEEARCKIGGFTPMTESYISYFRNLNCFIEACKENEKPRENILDVTYRGSKFMLEIINGSLKIYHDPITTNEVIQLKEYLTKFISAIENTPEDTLTYLRQLFFLMEDDVITSSKVSFL